MSYSVWGALAETPWWIYLSLVWFFFIAYYATKPKVVAFKNIAIYPFIPLVAVLTVIPFLFDISQTKAGILLLSIFPGLVFGYLQFRFSGTRSIKNTSTFYLPGSWAIFVVLITLISIKLYYSHHAINIDFSTLKHEYTTTAMVLICGFCLGIQIARLMGFYRCMKVGPFREST